MMAVAEIGSLIVGLLGLLGLSPINEWIREVLPTWVWPIDGVQGKLNEISDTLREILFKLRKKRDEDSRLLSQAEEGRVGVVSPEGQSLGTPAE